MTGPDKPTGPTGDPDAVEPDSLESTSKDAAAAETTAKDAPADKDAETRIATPKPRPTTAASRARRIGGGTAPTPIRPAARPEPVADEPTVRLGKKAKVGKGADTDTAEGKGAAAKQKAAAAKQKADDTDDDIDDDIDDDTPRRRTLAIPAWAAWVPAVAFVAVAAVFLALLLVNRLGSDDGSSTTSSQQRQTVLAATKNCVAATNTYRYTDIPKFQAAGSACTTGEYTKQYNNAINTLIKPNAAAQQFTQIAKVTSAGIEAVSSNGKQWTVLVFGQLNITTKAQPKGRIDPFYLVATMSQAKGKWVISRISLLSSVG